MSIHGIQNRMQTTSYGLVESIRLTNMSFQSLMQHNQRGWQELNNIALSSPWLFLKSRTLFPYLGMHNDLDALLATMTRQSKKVMIIGFNSHWQAMTQNHIFTLVRFTRTTNYIVAAGDELTLLVCIELNLPCYNASSYMLSAQKNVSMAQEGLYLDPYFLVMVWYLNPLYLDILRKGFTILKSDTDISYAGKDLWKTFELMVEKTGADLIFMRESPVNTGHFYATPNDRVIAFFEEWIALQKVFPTLNEQGALSSLDGKTFITCDSKKSCDHVKTLSMTTNYTRQLRTKMQTSKMAAVLTYPSPFSRFGSVCPPTRALNPCDQGILYVHPICMTGTLAKINKLKQLGFWLMADPCIKSKLDVTFRSSKFGNSSLIRCIPIPRLWPTVENTYLHCNNSEYIAPI